MAGKQSKPSSRWFDEDAGVPIIGEQAQRLGTFVSAMADGKVDDGEIQQQEQRVVTLMREIEPLLNADLHGKVTQLLCELTAYDMMNVLHTLQQARPSTKFRG